MISDDSHEPGQLIVGPGFNPPEVAVLYGGD